MISNLRADSYGHFTYINKKGIRCHATFPLFLIQEAWHRGVYFDDLADGFGPGLGTVGGDWSGIRDSSPQAVDKMLNRALNHLLTFAPDVG